VQTLGWGGTISNWRITSGEYFGSLVSTNTARAETGWSGVNAAAWANAAYDDLFARAFTTLETTPRLEAELAMLRIIMDELPVFPVYYGPIGFAARKGITGISQGAAWNHANTDDIHLWDITSY
jgi:ABC-type oligopeptide transport system substrate-binding subunit